MHTLGSLVAQLCVCVCQLQENAGTSLLEAFSVKEIDTHLASLSISPQVSVWPLIALLPAGY